MLLTTSNVVVLILGWLVLLSVVVFWIVKRSRRIFSGTKGEDLQAILDKILVSQEKQSLEIADLDTRIKTVVRQDKLHIQKVGLVRFNPFPETGGDHSFSLCLLDGEDRGFILTGLHTRERTRFYLKEVKNGKSSHELSKEEKESISRAQKFLR